jgi:hypothetical protein
MYNLPGDRDLIAARVIEYEKNKARNKSNNPKGCNRQPVNALDLNKGSIHTIYFLHSIHSSYLLSTHHHYIIITIIIIIKDLS